MAYYEHGGEIYDKDVMYDFSVNINAYGVPKSAKDAYEKAFDTVDQYPDVCCEKLTDAIKDFEKKHTGAELLNEQIICGNGASEIINNVFDYSKNKIALCQNPGFYGYERSLVNHGFKIVRGDNLLPMPSVKLRNDKNGEYFMPTMNMASQIEEHNPGVIVLCNPSNPIGSCINANVLEEIIKTANKIGSLVIIDECFLPFCKDFGERSAIKYIDKYHNIMIIRAFTKIFAIPGIRLGYAISSNRKWGENLRNSLPEWNVSGIAQEVGSALCSDDEYFTKSTEFIFSEREYLMQNMLFMGLDVIPPAANFIFFRTNKKINLKEELLKEKILIRKCDNYVGIPKSGYYRVCVKERCENEKLIEALKKILEK